MGTVVGFGNCQVQGMVKCASAALGLTPLYLHPSKVQEDPQILIDSLTEAEAVFATVGRRFREACDLVRSSGCGALPVVAAPNLHFSGYHPDVVLPSTAAGALRELPMGTANSAILLAAWRDGLDPEQAVTLFRDEVYEALGYYEAFDLATEMMAKECRRCDFDVLPLMQAWMANGPFVYVPLHPKMNALRDITLLQLEATGLYDRSVAAPLVDDELSRSLIWPVYPEIAERLGISGDYIFRPKNTRRRITAGFAPMGLESFVERTYECFRRSPPDLSSFTRMADPRLQSLQRFLKSKLPARRSNPYAQLPPSNWWSKSVAGQPAAEVDPIIRAKFTIGKSDKIATAGSCFAQHISQRLSIAGFNYIVTERAPPGCQDAAAEDYGVFTARFGNIYSVRQLLQLAERAYGRFEPVTDVWELPNDAGYVDPFRPRVGGKPFGSIAEVRSAREVHFAAVREMFETADVFVFTLGLTECWWSRDDQAVVPIAPGILGAKVPPDAYVPKNFSVVEVITDLRLLLELFQRLNPSVRIVLTVSPVPLMATFENDHVLAATTYSKSVLRAAAGEVANSNPHVAYFPSYEIVTGTFNRGRYFAEDLRKVTTAGVDHVMRSFLRHYAANGHAAGAASGSDSFRAEVAAAMETVCDEEEVANASSHAL